MTSSRDGSPGRLPVTDVHEREVGLALAAHTAWLERTVVAASGKEWSLSVADRFVLAGRTLLFYSKKFLVPLDLAFFYERWTIDPRTPRQWYSGAGRCPKRPPAARTRSARS